MSDLTHTADGTVVLDYTRPDGLVARTDFKAGPGKLLMLRFEDKVYQYQLIVDEHGTIVDQKKCPVPRG